MIKRILHIIVLSLIISMILPAPADARSGEFNSRERILRSSSQKKLVKTARDRNFALGFESGGGDTIQVIAVRVEFKNDTSSLTTGNGHFGMMGDVKEQRFYTQNDTTYRFDRLPHDWEYFNDQLTAVEKYYHKVSRGKLTIVSSVYPAATNSDGYRVDNPMTHYSPGYKRKNEKTDEYWDRKTHGLMMFVKDALAAVDDAQNSPFDSLYTDDNGVLRDAANYHYKTVILILRAGASYLTDGGKDGSPDSPSDMNDAFVDEEFFKFYKDTLKLDTAGVMVKGFGGVPFMINEVMLCAETSNQDGLNWGIQGILVNQMARQLGIPDLFSTSSGTSAIGAFCVMDFAGYSAAQGFIPPYPGAWVRAFMGWDTPRETTAKNTHGLKALTSVLDRRDAQDNLIFGNDTTILRIPINDHEYYLVENRQRNLSPNDGSRFEYTEKGGGIINSYPFNVNIPNNVKSVSETSSKVIQEVHNNDISLPASGVLVWHVDERIIRQRLAHNFVNADSAYRGVRLVEADGVSDLGVNFTNAFYQATYDYGGAEDVFPHTKKGGRVDSFGPYTRPSTRSNDGGHTYLSVNIGFNNGVVPARTERTLSYFMRDTITNYSDTLFSIYVEYDHRAQGWPRRAAPEGMFYDPLVVEGIAVSSSNIGIDTVLAVLSDSGRLYLYSVNRDKTYGNRIVPIDQTDYHGNPVESSLNAVFFDSIPGAFTFPTAIGGKIYVPSNQQKNIHVYNSIDLSNKELISLDTFPTSYVCGITSQSWAIGLANGKVAVGSNDGKLPIGYIDLTTKSPVCAIAAFNDGGAGVSFTVIQDDGTLSIITNNQLSNNPAPIKIKNTIPPYTIVTGDLDRDGKSEIIISDSRQGVWVYTRELQLPLGWEKRENPNDWASTYYIDPNGDPSRYRFPQNHSAPALADLNRDGSLDIVISGTNGIYALNRKGVLLSRWPAYLDNRFWYQRGSVTTSPIVVSGNNKPMVLFSSPTGENATFAVTKIKSAHKSKTGDGWTVTFEREDKSLDSLWDLSKGYIDTILTIGDSLVYPYILPGGFVDALTADAARPMERLGSRQVPQSRWPISIGSSAATSPVAWRSSSRTIPSLFAVSTNGMVYKWELPSESLSDSLYWPQNGFDAKRSFAYGGPVITDEKDIVRPKEAIEFWNYPNPTSKDDPSTTFKYRFREDMKNVRLDIHTITGRKMDTFKNLSGTGVIWNEHPVNLKRYGPGIYRCRLEATTINGKKYSKFWKMAVVK